MEAPPLERKLAAILAADVEGYSRLMHADEERTLATLTSHRAITDRLIEAANGQIFGTAGDSVLAEFPSVVQAFNCAITIQQALWRANSVLDEAHRMRLRIGINVGDIMVKNGDIFGDGVNIAARLEALADAGGICITRGVRDHLRDRVQAKFDDLGEHSVKNIALPVRVFRVQFDLEAEPAIDILPIDSPASLRSDPVDTPSEELVFWNSLQITGNPDEYRLYLDRYPDGAFADIARIRLSTSEQEPEDTAVEIAFWETVRDSNNSEMIRAYLNRYPQGAFSSLAAIMISQTSLKI